MLLTFGHRLRDGLGTNRSRPRAGPPPPTDYRHSEDSFPKVNPMTDVFKQARLNRKLEAAYRSGYAKGYSRAVQQVGQLMPKLGEDGFGICDLLASMELAAEGLSQGEEKN
jgi:hypothetical protein